MALITYTVTNADGTKEQKSFEYTPKTLEQIFAEAAKLADGETSGRKFEDRLYTVASNEGKEKAKFDRIKAELSGQDANVTTTDVSNLLKEAEQSNASGINRDKIMISVDEKVANDNFMRDMPTLGYPASAWEAKNLASQNKQAELANLNAAESNLMSTGNLFNTGGAANMDMANLAMTTNTGGTNIGGTNIGELAMTTGGGNVEPSANPTGPLGLGDMTGGGLAFDPTSIALRDIGPYDVFQQYLATSPYSVGALRRAAGSQFDPLYTQYVLQGAMPQQPNVGENPFLTFLGESRQVNPYAYAQSIRRAGDIAGMTDDQFYDAGLDQDLRAMALRNFFTGENQRAYELAAANLPFQQMVGSPLARGAISNVIQNMYDRFRANYPLTTDAGQPASFLNYIRSRNLGGLFGTTADQALNPQFSGAGGGAPALNLSGIASGNV
tara:strand:+ start:2683 stop:4005 length:1323 start_codon:yes stop_codon:yes gene_type:complete